MKNQLSHTLQSELHKFLPKERVLVDELSLAVISVDASFYDLRPQVIIDAISPREIEQILEFAVTHKIGVTFRAAGTSLSGQAQGDGILVRISRGWRKLKVLEQGQQISLEPGVIGAEANRLLKPYKRKIGPDPASINSCMIGGIAANNASGMCCGTSKNSYQTLRSMRIIMAPVHPGTASIVLDTGSADSRKEFSEAYPHLIDGITRLRDEVKSDLELSQLIKRKFQIKNTMGYALNALVDFHDPIDIMAHLMIGSEGTLGFISEINFNTVEDPPFTSSALVIFHSLGAACKAATILKTLPVSAAEMMDRASLRSVENKPGLPDFLATLPADATALLIQTSAPSAEILSQNEQAITETLSSASELQDSLYDKVVFSSNPKIYETWWDIRRGLLPSAGRSRPAGTTLIIEDVAFPIENLSPATVELSSLLDRHGYREQHATIFGHVLDGNLHFVFAQDFNSKSDTERYAVFMDELSDLVLNRWHGSLKAEHGTGRNMAPFVEKEWGVKAYSLMKRIKSLFDPQGVLNPGVLMNEDHNVHLANLKTTPKVDKEIDQCIECGFCEIRCPSRDLTVTPRQRIAAMREVARLELTSKIGSAEVLHLKSQLSYPVNETCATDGLCSLSCPVGINTGNFIKHYRSDLHKSSGIRGSIGIMLSMLIAKNFSFVLWCIRVALKLISFIPLPARGILKWIPKSAEPIKMVETKAVDPVVYFPSCIIRTMGPAKADVDQRSVHEAMMSIFHKAHFKPLMPESLSTLCCGLPFESKGYFEAGDLKLKELEAELLKVSDQGRIPIVCETSPCVLRMKSKMNPKLKIYESTEFVHDQMLSRLKFKTHPEQLGLHVTCSSQRMGLDSKLVAVSKKLGQSIIVPAGVGCCGFAGDKGFTHPELNDSALKLLHDQVQVCTAGLSNSRTCEIGLSKNAGISYQSIIYTIDKCTEEVNEI